MATACAGTPPAASPSGGADFAHAYEEALHDEATNPTAAEGYLALVDLAVADPDAPGALPAALAAVDALVSATTPGFEGSGPHAIAFRSRELVSTVTTRLRRAWYSAGAERSVPSANVAFIRGAIASALHGLALFVGDAKAASTWSARRGCVRTATLVGPFDWTPLRALEEPSPIDAHAPLAASYAGIAPFATAIAPQPAYADQCQLDVTAARGVPGAQAIIVDLTVPRAETIHVALTTSSAAAVDVGGVRALRRGYELGGRPVMRMASVDVQKPGQLRVVVHVAQKGDGNAIELDAWDSHGQPLVAHAVKPGVAADATASAARAVEITAPAEGGSASALLSAAGLLALGDARGASHLIEPRGSDATPRSAALDLVYARAVENADDLPDNKILERLRGAIDRTLAGWPTSWEARVGHARATERRRGAGEGLVEALRELGAAPGKAKSEAPLSPEKNQMIAAYVALSARRAQLFDVMETAYADLAKLAPDAPMHAAVDARLHARSGPNAVRAACEGGLSRADTDCFDAHRDRGDFGAALVELDRLRHLRGAEQGLKDFELSVRIAAGDHAGALKVYDSMSPGERRLLDTLGFSAAAAPAEAKARAARDRNTARDTPYALGSLARVLGLDPDPAPAFEAAGRKLVLADRQSAFLPGAGTAVLRHDERYAIDANGFVHWVFYDLRRVSGTTDVAQGGTLVGPMIEGRSVPRLLRKRIHKRDGRVLEPDAAANAAQASDLSQLEQGDYVEVIAEGWALPSDTGQLVLDTPDLLPERTSVREATIEIRRAASVPFAMWSHPLLGTPEEKVDGGMNVRVWRLSNQAPRRIEDGVPKMERNVAVSLGTQTWAQIARAIQENVRSLDDRDPYVVRWAEEAAGADRAVGKALVERVVAAVGKKVKVGSAGELSDVAAVFGGGAQRQTARTILELGQGSRSWVIYRALRELGVKVELAIAETEPFSAVASFPPHVGRFRHPLVVAHLGDAGGDIWIDADVEGPPLPPGRISPELRGRTAMLESGAMVTAPATGGEAGDEVDVRLALDDKGDARGTFTVLLHGRAAQGLAEAFETVVGTERREVLRGVVLAWLPWADVEDVAVSSSEGSWEIALRATIAIHGLGRPEGKDGKTWVLAGLEPVHTPFPRGPVGTLGGTYASRGARQNALSIEVPLQYHFRRRIELPAGATIARAPVDLDINDNNVHARRKLKATGNVVEEDFILSLPTGTVPAARYQAFVEKVQAIDDGFMAGTRIKVK
ncbi:Hypothetical protein A7982_09638 [Minicystis rosea]|nr:Hypothetical protein A7982_09638 [Minicystis rosea]